MTFELIKFPPGEEIKRSVQDTYGRFEPLVNSVHTSEKIMKYEEKLMNVTNVLKLLVHDS